jgi:glucose-6-phosphate 1-dehydrogenase
LSPCSENCEEKLKEFLKRTYYIDAGHDNKDGMEKLNSKMAHIEVDFELL